MATTGCNSEQCPALTGSVILRICPSGVRCWELGLQDSSVERRVLWEVTEALGSGFTERGYVIDASPLLALPSYMGGLTVL